MSFKKLRLKANCPFKVPNVVEMEADPENFQIRLADVDSWGLTNDMKDLIKEALANQVKLDVESVLGIWRKVDSINLPGVSSIIIWLEQGTEKAGYKHTVAEHALDFKNKGIMESQLAEVAEAATSVGHFVGF